MEPARQRSKKGCLTCRQKRKKCDEIQPVCGRCKGGDDCIWPTSQSSSKASSRPSRLPRIQPRPFLDPKSAVKYVLSSNVTSTPASTHISTPNIYAHESNTESLNPPPEVISGNGSRNILAYPPVGFASAWPINSNSPPELGTSLLTTNSNALQEYSLGMKFGLLVPAPNTLAFTCVDQEGPDHVLDEDEEDVFRLTEWLPETSQLVHLYLSIEPTYQRAQWSNIIDSYFAFMIRYSYDPSKLPAHFCSLVARHCQLESARLAVLGTSLLFYSFFNPGLPQAPLRKHANELIDAAAAALRFEESQPNTTLDAQLAGISEILGFYYYIGDLGNYIQYIEQAMPIVQKLVGAAPVSLHKLYGPETLDIRIFAWCDVFSAMATSRRTRLVYDCNVESLLQRNKEGPDTPLLDSGLEWMAGLPDAFLLLTIQIINLKHESVSPTERVGRAAKIEAALRGWKVWPSGITNSIMIIQRVSAQEIWRHFTILYLYQAVHKATPNQEVIQQSVKQIVKLASTLRPGHNPDCLLYIAYFLAGTFAISAKDRRFFRDRLIRCSFGTYMKTLVGVLDELWEGSPIDKHVDWTSRSPPLVIF